MNQKKNEKDVVREIALTLCDELNITPQQRRGMVIKSCILEAMAFLTKKHFGPVTLDQINQTIFDHFQAGMSMEEIKTGVESFIDELVEVDVLAGKMDGKYYPTVEGLLIGEMKRVPTEKDKQRFANVRNN